MIAGRLPLWPVPEGPWHYCDEHAALVGRSGICPGPAFDLGLAERSVTIQAAYAFGDWPPPGLVYDSPTRVAMTSRELFDRAADWPPPSPGDRCTCPNCEQRRGDR